jgi:predicted  nucleic acid-binding Zn-ribbon protein
MPDNSELDSPTAAVGEEEYFPTEKALLDKVYQLTEELEHSENFIKTLQTELDYQSQEHSDYRFKSEYETSRLRHLLTSLETDLASKKDELFDLKCELDQIDGQLRSFQITFDKVCRQRDDA